MKIGDNKDRTLFTLKVKILYFVYQKLIRKLDFDVPRVSIFLYRSFTRVISHPSSGKIGLTKKCCSSLHQQCIDLSFCNQELIM